MARRLKTTGCFRLFLFLLIFAPIAYFGARAINGEDVFAPLRKLIDKGEMNKSKNSSSANSHTEETMEIKSLQEQIKQLEKEIDQLKIENQNLRTELEEEKKR